MTRSPLFRTEVRVRLNAPNSAYHGQTGTVDAHELEQARKRDRTITLQLDDEHITIAFADELQAVDLTPRGTPCDKSQSPTPEAQP